MTNSNETLNLSSVELIKLTEYQKRQQVRGSFLAWCKESGYEPAAHHRIIIAALEDLVSNLIAALVRGRELETEKLRLMVMTPPGSAKSTYISKLFPPWFLAQMNRLRIAMTKEDKTRRVEPLGILACSHAAELAVGFGKAARNLIVGNERWLGYGLKPDSRAADEWITTHDCYYRAAGVGAGISGKRMHLGVIDDFCGQEQEAGSKLFNDTVWDWYLNDFVNRLQPIAARMLIANHRNEGDLCGRILADSKEAAKWRIIKLRLRIENEEQAADDPLNRKVGEILWPEYFTVEMVNERMNNPKASGIQQQEPSPAEGDMFKAEWLLGYKENETPTLNDARSYGASDHAVRTKSTNDPSCFGVGYFRDNTLFIHPDLEWDRFKTDIAVDKMLRLMKEHQPLVWWAERENISGSIGPFLYKKQMDDMVFVNVEEVSTGNKDKIAMAQSIIGLMGKGFVRFPTFAPWWPRAKYQLLKFPNGKNDDFITFISLLGKGIMRMFSPSNKVDNHPDPLKPEAFVPTLKWLKDSSNRKEKERRYALMDR